MSGMTLEPHTDGHESLDAIECLYRAQFASARQREGYKPPLSEDARDIQAQLLAAATQLIGQSKTVLDYGCGLGALIQPLHNACTAVQTYICVNHAGETGNWETPERHSWIPDTPPHIGAPHEPIENALREEIERLRAECPALSDMAFDHRTDAQLVKSMYACETEAADLLVCLDTLHHIPLSELPEKLASMLFHVRPGGAIVIADLQQATHYEVGRFWWHDDDLRQVLLDWTQDLKVRPLTVARGKTVLATGRRVATLPDPAALVSDLQNRCWSVYRRCALQKTAELPALRESALRHEADAQLGPTNHSRATGLPGEARAGTGGSDAKERFVRTQIEHRDVLQQMLSAEQHGWFDVLTPGDHLAVVTFHQTSTGRECEVAAELAAAYSAQGAVAKVLITLGQYDVCTIEEFNDLDAFRDAALITEPTAHVFNTNSHACFSLAPISGIVEGVETPTTLPLAELRDSLLGLCFLKLNPQHVAEHGFRAESAVVAELLRRAAHGQILQNCRYSFLGGLGWNELVLLLSSDDAEAIYEAVAKVRDLPHPLSPDGSPALLTSFTVLGTEHDKVSMADSAMAGFDLAIGVSTFGGQKERVRRDLLASCSLDDCAWRGVLGKVDFLGIRPAGNGGINQVIALRQDPAIRSQLLNTSTIPMARLRGVTAPTQDPCADAATPSPPDLSGENSAASCRCEPAQVEKLTTPSGSVAPDPGAEELRLYREFRNVMPLSSPAVHLVRQVFSEYISCTHDPLLRYDVLDLRRALHRIQAEAVAWNGEDWGQDHEHILYNAARVVLYGLRQRYTGTYDTIYNLNDVNTTGMAVGAQRLIGASEAICSTVLARYSPAPWSGFVVYGNAVVPFRDHFGAFNFPSEIAFDLCNGARLWYLHELGHELAAAADRRLFEVDVAQTDLTQLDQRDLQADMMADIFVLIAGFDGSLDAYFSTLKKHIYSMLHEPDPWWRTRYVQRILGLCAYGTVVEHQRDKASPEFNLGGYLQLLTQHGCIDADERTVEFVQEQLVPELLLPGLTPEERRIKTVAQVAWIIERVDLWHQEWLGPVVGEMRLQSYLPSSAYVQQMAASLREGKITLAPLLCWPEVLREIDQTEVSVRQHMAMIISLWHTWVQSTSHSTDICGTPWAGVQSS